MVQYYVAERDTGHRLSYFFDTDAEAENERIELEEQDKLEGYYVEGYYKVVRIDFGKDEGAW